MENMDILNNNWTKQNHMHNVESCMKEQYPWSAKVWTLQLPQWSVANSDRSRVAAGEAGALVWNICQDDSAWPWISLTKFSPSPDLIFPLQENRITTFYMLDIWSPCVNSMNWCLALILRMSGTYVKRSV